MAARVVVLVTVSTALIVLVAMTTAFTMLVIMIVRRHVRTGISRVESTHKGSFSPVVRLALGVTDETATGSIQLQHVLT